MPVLNDREILSAIANKDISINPLSLDRIQPASVDLSLGNTIQLIQNTSDLDISNVSKPDLVARQCEVEFPADGFHLQPGQYVVCNTAETLGLSDRICAHLFNRSSLVRWGIDATKANFINPGFSGRVPLVIHNFGCTTVVLRPGMIICQAQFHHLQSEPLHSYENRHDPEIIAPEANKTGFLFASGKDRRKDPLSQFLHDEISKISIGK